MEHRSACELTMEVSIRQMHIGDFVDTQNSQYSPTKWCSRELQQSDHRDDSMSAGRSKAAEDVLGASIVDSCENSQLVSHIQQREAPFTDRDALWETIENEIFACVRLPGVHSESRQQTETGFKGQEKQVHRLQRGEQSLPTHGSRNKTNGVSKKRDIQGEHHSIRLHG